MGTRLIKFHKIPPKNSYIILYSQLLSFLQKRLNTSQIWRAYKKYVNDFTKNFIKPAKKIMIPV